MKGLAMSKLERREAVHGYLFLLPLLFGLIMFFLIPIVKSFLFSISSVASSSAGYTFRLRGLQAYYTALFVDNSYRQTVTAAFLKMLITAPLVIIFSFFMASVLNQKFRGRTFFRVVLFIPVIITMTVVSGSNALESQMTGFTSYKSSFSTGAVYFTAQITQYLENIGVSAAIAGGITSIADQIYSVIRLSGIQILVMLTGMQSISPSLYEAAKVEGGTAWENFWKITFPMVSPLVITCVVYTIVDTFTSNGNDVMQLIQTTAFSGFDFSLASAMSWLYFAVVGLFLGLVTWLVSRFSFYYN